VVPRARPGVGAVATQAFAEPAYGWRVLDAIEQGADAAAALAAARSADPDAALRQVGVVSRDGSAGAFSGALCIDHAGHHVGDGYAVQANMAASPAVWPAMAETFECLGGPLAERLTAALRAGQAAGGDARGATSAALLVVDGTSTVVDLRVDDHPESLAELTRLLRSNDAFRASSAPAMRCLRVSLPRRWPRSSAPSPSFPTTRTYASFTLARCYSTTASQRPNRR
jgi:uncharacterized Ntn-hydrolase superfamily protein